MAPSAVAGRRSADAGMMVVRGPAHARAPGSARAPPRIYEVFRGEGLARTRAARGAPAIRGALGTDALVVLRGAASRGAGRRARAKAARATYQPHAKAVARRVPECYPERGPGDGAIRHRDLMPLARGRVLNRQGPSTVDAPRDSNRDRRRRRRRRRFLLRGRGRGSLLLGLLLLARLLCLAARPFDRRSTISARP